MTEPPLLEVRNLGVAFGDGDDDGTARPVDGVSLRLEAGEIVGLVGESGSGKTLTALSLLRLLPEAARFRPGSRVLLQGRDLLELPEDRMRRVRGREIAMVFQEPMTSLNPVLSVGAQVEEAVRRHLGLRGRAAREAAVRAMERAGLDAPARRYGAYPHELSGGERQRVCIAMAVAPGPSVLVADEPTSALDVTVQARILALLDSLRREEGMAVLLISHDLGLVGSTADRVAVMYAGQVVETGGTEEILGEPRHPYTRGLLGAVPDPRRPRARLRAVEGTPPSPEDWPDGCRFHPRCPHAWERCRTEPPPLISAGRGRSRCWLVEEPGRRRREADEEAAAPSVGPRGEPLLEARGLRKVYPGRRGGLLRRLTGRRGADGRDGDAGAAVEEVSLVLRRGETLGLVGESGCGKSTTARLLTGLERPTSGRVLFRGRDVGEMRKEELAAFRRRVGIVFQDPYGSLNPRLTVGSALREALRYHDIARGEAARRRIRELLEMVGLEAGHAERYPNELSGGQRQRVCIARALCLEPEVLVADEPVSALDVSVQAQILNLLADLSEELGIGVLFIGHDLAVVRHATQRVAVMYGGRIVETGPADDLYRRPLHPYTRALLAAAPGRLSRDDDPPRESRREGDGGGEEPGSVPGGSRGCPFYSRCTHPGRDESCLARVPSLEEKEAGRRARCIKVG